MGAPGDSFPAIPAAAAAPAASAKVFVVLGCYYLTVGRGCRQRSRGRKARVHWLVLLLLLLLLLLGLPKAHERLVYLRLWRRLHPESMLLLLLLLLCLENCEIPCSTLCCSRQLFLRRRRLPRVWIEPIFHEKEAERPDARRNTVSPAPTGAAARELNDGVATRSVLLLSSPLRPPQSTKPFTALRSKKMMGPKRSCGEKELGTTGWLMFIGTT